MALDLHPNRSEEGSKVDQEIPAALVLPPEAAAAVAERMADVDARLDRLPPTELAARRDRQQARARKAAASIQPHRPPKLATIS